MIWLVTSACGCVIGFWVGELPPFEWFVYVGLWFGGFVFGTYGLR